MMPRLFRHLIGEEFAVRRAFPPAVRSRIAGAIAEQERRHTGELRFVIEGGLAPSRLWRHQTPRERAVELFAGMGVWDTEANNGVLIYVLLADRAVEIIADRGIDRRVDQGEWQAICARMEAPFAQGRYGEGVTGGVTEISALLARHYPRTAGAENELPDRPVVL